MNTYRVKILCWEGEFEKIIDAETPEEAAANQIGKLPADDGLDYPDDFWDIVVPIAEGKERIEIKRTSENESSWYWPKGKTLSWPIDVTITMVNTIS
jgi:hypothetical protein